LILICKPQPTTVKYRIQEHNRNRRGTHTPPDHRVHSSNYPVDDTHPHRRKPPAQRAGSMHALVFDGIRQIRFRTDQPLPQLEKETDAVVRVTFCAICGSDLHPFRGDERGIAPGTGGWGRLLGGRRVVLQLVRRFMRLDA